MTNKTSKLYDFGAFRVDTVARVVIHKQHLVRLHPKTFDTLVELIRITLDKGRNEIVTKDELMARLWTGPDVVEENNLADEISHLRAALFDDPHRPKYIGTVYGKGYRFLQDIEVLERDEGASVASERIREYERKVTVAEAEVAEAKVEAYQAHKSFIAAKRIGIVYAVITALGAFGIGAFLFSRQEVEPTVTKLSLTTTAMIEEPAFAISRDGKALVFSAISGGQRNLYKRPLNALSATKLEGTEGASYPFWSPDGLWIGFFSEGKLLKMKIDSGGGVPQLLCAAPRPGGGSWNGDGVIIFAPELTGQLFKIAAMGEIHRPEPVTRISSTELAHLWPHFLPDNEHFLFTARAGDPDERSIRIGSLRSMITKPALAGLNSNSNAVYAPIGRGLGRLLFMRGETLMAEQFNADKLQVTGTATKVGSEVGFIESTSRGEFSVSYNGTLVYGGQVEQRAQLIWYSRTGEQLENIGKPDYILQHSLSPDGQRVAVDRLNLTTGTYDIWIQNLSTGTNNRITSDRFDDYSAFWSPDGKRLVYACYASNDPQTTGYANLCERAADGPRSEKMLIPSKETQIPTDWSRDGKYVLYYVRDSESTPGKSPRRQMRLFQMDDGRVIKFPSSDSDEWQSVFSPDVKWIAYTTKVSGTDQVYVRQFSPGDAARYPVSTEGGSLPHWRPDGKELFYISQNQNLTSVSFDARSVKIGKPVKLFEARFERPGTIVYSYAVSADGNRFLVRVASKHEPRSLPTVVRNWTAELKP